MKIAIVVAALCLASCGSPYSPPDPPLGSHCSVNLDCGDGSFGQVCLPPPQFPGGFCTQQNCEAGCISSNGYEGKCVSTAGGSFCFVRCDVQTGNGCNPSGWHCDPSNAVCFPN